MTRPAHTCGGTYFTLLRTMTKSRTYQIDLTADRVAAHSDWEATPHGYDIAEVSCLTCGEKLPAGSDLLAAVLKVAHAAFAGNVALR